MIASTGCAFPILHELQVVLALVQAGEMRHLSPDRPESLTDLLVGGFATGIECLVRRGDGHLSRYHPRMEGSSNGAQVTQCLARTRPSAGDSDQPEHLSFEQFSARQIQRILENPLTLP